MDTNSLTGNYRTSILGAVLGVFNYLTQNGTTFPSNKQEWGNAGISLGLALLGALAKDAAVGSKAQ